MRSTYFHTNMYNISTRSLNIRQGLVSDKEDKVACWFYGVIHVLIYFHSIDVQKSCSLSWLRKQDLTRLPVTLCNLLNENDLYNTWMKVTPMDDVRLVLYDCVSIKVTEIIGEWRTTYLHTKLRTSLISKSAQPSLLGNKRSIRHTAKNMLITIKSEEHQWNPISLWCSRRLRSDCSFSINHHEKA